MDACFFAWRSGGLAQGKHHERAAGNRHDGETQTGAPDALTEFIHKLIHAAEKFWEGGNVAAGWLLHVDLLSSGGDGFAVRAGDNEGGGARAAAGGFGELVGRPG